MILATSNHKFNEAIIEVLQASCEKDESIAFIEVVHSKLSDLLQKSNELNQSLTIRAGIFIH